MHLRPVIFILFTCITGCSSMRESAKYRFGDGYYTMHQDGKQRVRIYADNEADGVYIYGITKGQQIVIGDTTEPVLSFPQSISRQPVPSTRFSRSSFDIDFLTIPLKFRPSRVEVPMQLEPNLSGALYLGYRNDMYANHFRQEPKGYLRQTTHIGFSLGAFAGLGNSVINPTMTGFATDQEYNGVVLLYGIALIAGIDRITLGLTLGADELMDANKNKWIYQRKPWIGIGFGLNLN